MWCVLCMLEFLHQKVASSHEWSFESSLDTLNFGFPPHKHHENISTRLLAINNLDLKSLHNTSEGKLMMFGSDYTHLCLDSCITGALTYFKSDFIEGSCTEVPEKSPDIATVKALTIGEGIAACTLKEDNGDLCTLKTHMAHVPSIKFRLIASQWLGI